MAVPSANPVARLWIDKRSGELGGLRCPHGAIEALKVDAVVPEVFGRGVQTAVLALVSSTLFVFKRAKIDCGMIFDHIARVDIFRLACRVICDIEIACILIRDQVILANLAFSIPVTSDKVDVVLLAFAVIAWQVKVLGLLLATPRFRSDAAESSRCGACKTH